MISFDSRPELRDSGRAARRRWLAGLLVAGFGLSSCTALDPFTGEREVSKTTKGAVIGGLAGAATGALTGRDSRERRKRALIGAGVGALAGGAVGQYMDRQEAALRERLARTGVGVSRMGDEIQLIMPGNITFATNQADIRAEFFDVLNSVAIVLKEYDKTLVEITGHTDSTGGADLNQRLSEQRADSVRRYLGAQGIREVRLAARGLGPSSPIASNATPEGRQQNRRVEIRLVPLTD